VDDLVNGTPPGPPRFRGAPHGFGFGFHGGDGPPPSAAPAA